MMRYPVRVAAVVFLAAIACTCGPFAGSLRTTPIPDSLTEQAPASPAATATDESSTLTATEQGDSQPPTLEPSVVSDPTTYYQAMREGFASDVDAHSGTLYQVAISVTDDPVHVEGVERVQFANQTGDTLDEIVFRLYSNALTPQDTLFIRTVEVNDEGVDVVLDVNNTALVVPLAKSLAPEESVEITLTFTLELPPGEQVGWGRLADTQVIVLSSFLPMLSVYEADGWWMEWPDDTGDPAYSVVALWDVLLEAPADLKVAATGTQTGEPESTGSGTLQYHFVTGPVRDYSIALSQEFELTTGTQDGITINIWSLPGDEPVDREALDITAQAVKVFDEQFGAYPFNELDVVEASIDAAGIEYPGLIYIAEGVWDNSDNSYFGWVLVHETAHQWWYSMVGNNQVEAPWLDEGLTEYSVEVYYRETGGAQAGHIIRQVYQDELDNYLDAGYEREPVGLPAETYDGYEYRVFVYSAGALFYSYLADEYGEEAVIGFLQDYFSHFRYDLVENEELQQLVAERFGDEAGEFFTDWVYTGD